jgi:hypothetical protein
MTRRYAFSSFSLTLPSLRLVAPASGLSRLRHGGDAIFDSVLVCYTPAARRPAVAVDPTDPALSTSDYIYYDDGTYARPRRHVRRQRRWTGDSGSADDPEDIDSTNPANRPPHTPQSVAQHARPASWCSLRPDQAVYATRAQLFADLRTGSTPRLRSPRTSGRAHCSTRVTAFARTADDDDDHDGGSVRACPR